MAQRTERAARELKRLFFKLAEQRRDFAKELLPYAHRLGGASVADGTRSGGGGNGQRKCLIRKKEVGGGGGSRK
jgi:hypothetical protein